MLSVRPSIFFSWSHLAVGTVLVVVLEGWASRARACKIDWYHGYIYPSQSLSRASS